MKIFHLHLHQTPQIPSISKTKNFPQIQPKCAPQFCSLPSAVPPWPSLQLFPLKSVPNLPSVRALVALLSAVLPTSSARLIWTVPNVCPHPANPDPLLPLTKIIFKRILSCANIDVNSTQKAEEHRGLYRYLCRYWPTRSLLCPPRCKFLTLFLVFLVYSVLFWYEGFKS